MIDSEMQSVLGRLRAPDSPVTIETQTLAVELPLGRTPRSGRGSIVEAHISRITPGRVEAGLELGRRVCDFVEANGAVNARSFQLAYAGSGSGLVLSSWEFDSMQAWGKLADAFGNDPEGQAIALASAGADSSATLVFSGVYNEIPL